MSHVILFVDDEPDVLELLGRTFTAHDGYEALTASSGEEALRVLAGREVDLLVTDQRMPGMSGVELVERARRRQPDLCAILLTAYTDPREIVDAINRGEVYRYVVKPWESADLRQTVVRALEQVHLKRERARFLADAERRLVALEAASEIARDVGAADGPERLLQRVVERLPRIVPCDVAAALLSTPGEAPTLLIRPVAELDERALLQVKEDAIAAHRERSGSTVDEATLRLSVLGRGEGARAGSFASRLTLPVQLAGAAAGVVLVESAAEEAFTEGDARVLDVLVNEVADALRALTLRLAGERERMERVVECMADGLLYAAKGSGEIVANPAARRLLGAPLDRPLDGGWLEQALGFDPFDVVRGLMAERGRSDAVGEVRVGDRTLASTVSPVLEREGRLAGVAVALRDVTEQKRLEERKEEFVQVVSHELRTPLTSITGALDLVLGGLAGETSAKQARYLRMARESSERLNSMVDDLLDVARLAKGKLEMEPGVVLLDDLVRTAAERYVPAASERGQELVVEAAPPARIVGDAARLGQVLANLLTNAVKFTPDNGVIRVRVLRSAAVTGVAGVSVWNGGEGIPEADLERIFEKFEQARSERTKRVQGTGLGLAISRGIVAAHGGWIWAESAPGEGARFVVVLPEQPPPAPPERERQPPPAAAVAVVVDEPDASGLVSGVLRAAGVVCHRAATAEDALALARRHRPGLVVWDPLLPALKGLPLSEILRHDADTRRAAVLAFTAPEGRDAAFRGGADEFLAKPASPAALAEAALAMVRGGRPPGARVLVVDDDPAIRSICAEVLRGHGYAVEEAGTCAEARRQVVEHPPELILVDVQLPDGDGFSLLEGLADTRAAGRFAAVFLTARGEVADKVRGLRLGADDYLTKPFDAQELVARVDAVLRRREAALHASPMTRLPGGRAIDQEVERRLDAAVPFELSYVDLDNLKAYNDTYGYAKADGVVLQTAGILRDVVRERGGEGSFLGHVGGDDFVFLTGPDRARPVCADIIAAFDRVIPLYYDREDRERGYIEAMDRFGTRRQFPILSLSIATVVAARGRFRHHADLARAAAELKQRAKRIAGSVHLVDDGGGGAA